MAFLIGVFTFSILDKVIDFDEYDSFTLNGIDYAPPPRRNSPSEDFELYDKMQKEYFDANNISFYGRNKESIRTIMFLLAFGLMARTFLRPSTNTIPISSDSFHVFPSIDHLCQSEDYMH